MRDQDPKQISRNIVHSENGVSIQNCDSKTKRMKNGMKD